MKNILQYLRDHAAALAAIAYAASHSGLISDKVSLFLSACASVFSVTA